MDGIDGAGIDSAGFEPYYYETDENGAIKMIPNPECHVTVTYGGLSLPESLILAELTEIKDLLKEILKKL